VSYSIEVYPTQSWISPTPVNVNVFVVNPLVLAFPASGLGLLMMVVKRRRSLAVAPVQVPKVEESLPPPAPIRTPPGGLAGIYAEAAELVGKSVGVLPQPQQTVREYLDLVRGMTKGFGHFDYITTAHETNLYGPAVGMDVERRAQAELLALRRELEA
jgi:hypothetical protein